MATTIRTDISSKIDIVARKDDTFQLKLNITKSDGTALDLTGATAEFSVRTLDNATFKIGAKSGTESITNTQTDNGSTAGSGSSIRGISSDGSTGTLGADGVLVVHMSKGLTNTIAAGVYLYGLQIKIGSLSQTFLSGKFTLNEDIVGQHGTSS